MKNEQKKKKKVIAVCGPTCSGKTSLGIEIALNTGGEIIGADSMQIYKLMDIGTAKPTPEEINTVKHHLVSSIDVDEHFDAKRFCEQARQIADSLINKGRVPVLVGGTGLYIKAFLHGLFESFPRDESIEKRLRLEAEENGPQALHERLSGIDPDAAGRIHPNDTYRIVRALEIFETSNITITQRQEMHSFDDSPYDALKIGISIDRETLYDRINRRVDIMMDQGFVDEVQGLVDAGFSPALKSMQSLGYRHVCEFLDGKIDMDEAVRTMKRDTRHYAKRQMTWFSKDTEITWLKPDEFHVMEKLALDFLG